MQWVSPTMLLAVLGFAWHLSAKLTRIEENIHLILTNHLPHIEARLARLEARDGR